VEATLIYVGIDLFLLFSVFIAFFAYLPYFFKQATKINNACICFIRNHENSFNLFFILLYVIEQVFLIIATYYFENNISILKLIISVFALLVLTTASIQKLILDIKMQQIKLSLNKSNRIIAVYKYKYSDLISKIENSK